jgi:hypothetical protein
MPSHAIPPGRDSRVQPETTRRRGLLDVWWRLSGCQRRPAQPAGSAGRAFVACMAATLAGALVAGCSSSHVLGPRPSPGYESPDNAVAGWIDNLLQNDAAAACSYNQPAVQAACTTVIQEEGLRFTGKWGLGKTAISGNRAIVDIEYDRYCGGGTCISNSNPHAGLPGPGLSFTAAFQRALNTSDYALGCVRVGGQWYVDAVSQG